MSFHSIQVLRTTLEIEECSTPGVLKLYFGSETSYIGPNIWVLVPDEFRSLDTLVSFKVAIKKWKLNNCPCHLANNIYVSLALCN